jgi:hypothetical protein
MSTSYSVKLSYRHGRTGTPDIDLLKALRALARARG